MKPGTLTGDLLAAADANTGDSFGHTRLGTTHGWSDWIDDPVHTWTGLHLNHGNGTCHSWLARPIPDGDIQILAPAGRAVTAFHHTEPQYLAMSCQAARLTIHDTDTDTDTVLAERSSDTLAGPDSQLLTATVVSDALVLAGFNLDDHATNAATTLDGRLSPPGPTTRHSPQYRVRRLAHQNRKKLVFVAAGVR